MTLQELRSLSGMTQQQFADYFGIPKRTIEDWEAGRRTPTEYIMGLIEYKLRKERIIK